MTKLLALNSIRGKSGKDTLIGLLESEGRTVGRVAFGDVLKERCSQVLAGGPSCEATTYEKGMHTSVKDSPSPALSIHLIAASSYKYWLLATQIEDKADLDAPRSLRWHLQKFGTEYSREFMGQPDIWLDEGFKVLQARREEKPDFIVVTDLRQVNEYDQLTLNGFATVRIVRDWFIPQVDDQPYHITDIALMAHKFDALVVNELGDPWGMLNQLYEQGVI